MMQKKNKYFLLITVFLFLACNSDVISKSSNGFRVLEVVDGDTFIIDDDYNSRVRMLGINTPEIFTGDGPGEPFATQAKKYLEDSIEGKTVRFEYGNERFDPYGRILAYIFLDDLFVNEEILRKGLARKFIFNEGIKYKDRLLSAESLARKNKKGIWSPVESYKYPNRNGDFLIKPVDARRYLDQRVVVRGKVTSSKENKSVVTLKIDDDLDIVIFKDSLSNFRHFGINPKNKYLGQLVEVIGRVSVYRGRTQIKVYHPISIKNLK